MGAADMAVQTGKMGAMFDLGRKGTGGYRTLPLLYRRHPGEGYCKVKSAILALDASSNTTIPTHFGHQIDMIFNL